MDHGQENDSPHFEWCIRKCPGLCTIFLLNKQMLPKVYALLRIYLDVLDTLDSFHVYAQTKLLGLY